MQKEINNNTDMSEKVQKYFSNRISQFQQSNPIVELRKKIIHELLGDLDNSEIIDVGCGNGKVSSQYIERNEITYMDISSEILDLAAKNIPSHYISKTTFINGNILTASIKKNFDIVLCIGLYAHVSDITLLTQKLNELTNNEGKIIIQFTDNDKFIAKLNILKNSFFKKNYPYKINQTTCNQIENIIKKNNLIILRKIRYWPVSPFFTFFSNIARLKLLMHFYKNKLLSRFGSEVILLVKKGS